MKPSTVASVVEPVDLDAYLALYLDAVRRGERRAAVDVAVGLLERGVDPERVITDLLAGAQREIGLGWQAGELSVSVEHRASAITESALSAVGDAAMRAPGAVVEGCLGRAIVACSEGEWHVLPGRMASEVLRVRGVDVSFIGPSVPAADLAAMLGDDPPSAVAITCSMPMSLMGSWTTISALRALGTTIIAGGRGFGPDGRWAATLGADLWAADFSAGADFLLGVADTSIREPRPPAGEPATTAEIGSLLLQFDTLVDSAMSAAVRYWPAFTHSASAMRATREDISTTLKVCGAATLTGDSAIVGDLVEWFESVLSARDLPLAFVSSAFELVLEVLPDELEQVRHMASLGLAACAQAPLPRSA